MPANVFTKAVRDRWIGTTVGATSVTVFLLFGMAIYRDIDLTLYSDLPEAVRDLMNIPAEADVGGLAYGAIYGFTGAMTLAALAISMGSSSIAGEERDGTLGLLLANPKSRTRVLLSKSAAIVSISGFGAGILWVGGRLAPWLLGVDVTGMEIDAQVVHIFVNAVFYGLLAMMIGAWTGNRTLAAGSAAGVMVVSYLAVGILPLVEGGVQVAKAFPWYYYDASQPVNNGIEWVHLGVLTGVGVLFVAGGLIGLNRRDLRGHSVGVTLIDRLRRYPLTQRAAERLAGSARVSRVSIKTASEHQGMLIVTSLIMVSLGMMVGPIYGLMDEQLEDFGAQLPDSLLAVFGASDMATPEGFYQVESFSLVGPIAIISLTAAIGARALAGEEARNTMGLLLANPIRRSRVVIEKALAMIAHGFALGVATFVGTVLGSLLGGLDMDVGHIAATSLLLTLLGLVFGGAALTLSAATGSVKVATFGAAGLALGCYLVNALLPLNDSLAGQARWSPFHYYLDGDPLLHGMNWGHGAVLAALSATLIAGSVVLFERRDLR